MGEMRKLLKDYPLNTWLEAADGCQYCGATYQVRIRWVNPEGNLGDVETRISHRKDCPEGLDEDLGVWHEVQETRDIGGWDYAENPVKFFGLEFYPLKFRANIGSCLMCEKLIVGIPLILFLGQGRRGELDFCFPCAEKHGFLKALIGGRP